MSFPENRLPFAAPVFTGSKSSSGSPFARRTVGRPSHAHCMSPRFYVTLVRLNLKWKDGYFEHLLSRHSFFEK
jgi:hypothetical protein